MLGGRFDDHRPVYPPHFLRSSASSWRARARPFRGIARRCDGALKTGLASCRRHAPCCLFQVRLPSPCGVRPAQWAVGNRPCAASSPAKLLREDLLARPPDEALLLLSFGCTRGRSAWSYRERGPRSCRTGRRWTAGCPLACRPIGARCCTRHSSCSGPPSELGCDRPGG